MKSERWLDRIGHERWGDLSTGELHRFDGPAVVTWDGNRLWYQNNELHRVTGPAIEWCDGRGEYWISGKFFVDESEWEEHPLVLEFRLNRALKELASED